MISQYLASSLRNVWMMMKYLRWIMEIYLIWLKEHYSLNIKEKLWLKYMLPVTEKSDCYMLIIRRLVTMIYFVFNILQEDLQSDG